VYLQHDSGPDCVPTTEDPNHQEGNFIMFASATSGDRANNHKFSTCSISNITLVVDAILNSDSSMSFPSVFVQVVICISLQIKAKIIASWSRRLPSAAMLSARRMSNAIVALRRTVIRLIAAVTPMATNSSAPSNQMPHAGLPCT
jgi:hypothetical protein